MQFFKLAASLLLVAGVASASSSSTVDAKAIPEAAAKFILEKTGVNVHDERRSLPIDRMHKASAAKRQDTTVVTGDCSSGKTQCCDTTMSGDDADTLTSLIGLDNVAGSIGINCVNLPINVIGVAGTFSNICKSTPVCCQNVTQNGLVNLGCSALPIN